jgi:hypothetical protein
VILPFGTELEVNEAGIESSSYHQDIFEVAVAHYTLAVQEKTELQ